MAAKTDIEVVIDKKVYKLSGYEEPEYLQKVANYLNGKIEELKSMEGISRLTNDMRALLLQINIVDDYFKAKEAADRLQNDWQGRDKEMYELKHSIVGDKERIEELERENKQYRSKIQEMEVLRAKMEESLENALFGKPAVKSDEEG